MKSTIFLLSSILVFVMGANSQSGDVRFSKSVKPFEAATEFKSGDYIYAEIKFAAPVGTMLTLNDRPVTFTTEFYSGGKLLDEEMYGVETDRVRASKSVSMMVPVISDPAYDLPQFGKNLFAYRLPAALANLAPGTHEIEFKLKSYNFKDGNDVLAASKFTLTIEAGASAWYKKNEKDAYDAFGKRGVTTVIASERDVALGVVGGKNVITLVNNCGRSVWMRKALGSDKREYRLAPGQEMKYDADGGYLEEWNFGTKKWNTVTKVWEPGPNGKANICK